jgi:hypothetical protein
VVEGLRPPGDLEDGVLLVADRAVVVHRDGDGVLERPEVLVEERRGGDACGRGAERRFTVNLRAPGSAVPEAMATWPRGMASVCRMVPVAGSHSQ